MKSSYIIRSITAVIIFIGSAAMLHADDQPPKYTVQEIMKAVYKGEDALNKRVVSGKATSEDYDKLVQYLTALPLNDAPQGDPAGWKKKTTALLDAATALKGNKPDALAQYKLAVNCQACHSVYRPE
jgi:cytochrome c556